jgi:RNA ligase (TIGR02306 family)
MVKSTHLSEVIRIKEINPHPNADKLCIVSVYGYTVCVRISDFKVGDLAIYIPPDNIVSDRPEFAFLEDHKRIKVRKLRGIISMGLLIQVPADLADLKEGDDAAEKLKIIHYEPPLPMSTGGEAEKPPEGYFPHYDVDSYYRYITLFKPGELVVGTEKIHGGSSKFVWGADDRIHVGSRTEWKREDDKNIWWRAAKNSPWLVEFCKAHPDICVYGEVYGIQDLKYGHAGGRVSLAVFDLLRGDEWIPHTEARKIGADLKWVPIVYEGPFDEAVLKKLADGKSLIPGADNIREGIVVKPLAERTDPEIGRVQLKMVSNEYLERA